MLPSQTFFLCVYLLSSWLPIRFAEGCLGSVRRHLRWNGGTTGRQPTTRKCLLGFGAHCLGCYLVGHKISVPWKCGTTLPMFHCRWLQMVATSLLLHRKRLQLACSLVTSKLAGLVECYAGSFLAICKPCLRVPIVKTCAAALGLWILMSIIEDSLL